MSTDAATAATHSSAHGFRRLRDAFAKAKAEGRAALIPYVTAGDPDLELTKALVPALVKAGADIIEVGLPYSDPLADGPTIQRSGQRALAAGTTRRGVLDAIAVMRKQGVQAPIVMLTYYNSIYRRGERRFMAEAAEAGVDGVVTPDLPPEEAHSLRKAAAEAGVALVPLVAPTSTPQRLRFIGDVAQGFIYCVSVAGVTGARAALSQSLPGFLRNVRNASRPDMPLALGFGISDGDQAKAAAALADGVIVGSALIDKLEAAASRDEALRIGSAFVRGLRAALEEASIVG